MKILKLILGLIAVICLAIIIITKSAISAIVLLALASMSVGILIGEGANKNGIIQKKNSK